MTSIGNSGPLPEAVAEAIEKVSFIFYQISYEKVNNNNRKYNVLMIYDNNMKKANNFSW